MSLSTPKKFGHILDADTLALWRLDEFNNPAPAYDETGAYNCTNLSGLFLSSVDAAIGRARIAGSGVAQSAAIPVNDKAVAMFRSGIFTAEGWFNLTLDYGYPATFPGPGNNHACLLGMTGAGNGTVFMFGLTATGFFLYNITHGFLELGSWQGIRIDSWHHLAVRCSYLSSTQSTVDFFYDGLKVASGVITNYALVPSTTPVFTIGGEGTAFNLYNGNIDEIRLSKIARTDAEIFDSYRRTALGLGPDTVSPVARITDHVTRAANALIEQYKNKSKMVGLLSAFSSQIQDLEDGMWPAISENNLQCASGDELDVLGRIVGEPRSGRGDVSYRTFIQARILLNLSSGTVEEIYAIFALVLLVNNLAPTMEIDEYFPKAIVLRLRNAAVPDSVAADLRAILLKAKDAGARATLEYGNTLPFFGFDGSTGSGFDTGYFGGAL